MCAENSSCGKRGPDVSYAPLVSQAPHHNSPPPRAMFHQPVSGLAGIAFLVLCAQIAGAQDFHVDTQIYNLHAPPPKGVAAKAPKPELVDACESLFHAGKV